jgi:hypothetical protein
MGGSLQTIHCKSYRSNCKFYRLKCKFYRLKCKFYRLKCKFYRLKCKFYRLKCKFYRLKCTIYRLKSKFYKFTLVCEIYSLFDNLQKHGAISTEKRHSRRHLKSSERSEGNLFDHVDNNMLNYTNMHVV